MNSRDLSALSETNIAIFDYLKKNQNFKKSKPFKLSK